MSPNEETDLHGLIYVYKDIVYAVRTAIVEGGSIEKIKEKIFFEIYKDKVLMKFHHMLDSIRSAQISFLSYNADGNAVEFNENLPLHSLLFKASNVGSQDFGNLGEIIFGESFIIKNGKTIILTENVKEIVL